MYLLDTNIISELRKPRPYPELVSWLRNIPDSSLYISAVTIGEIQAGIEITREQDIAKAMMIEEWAIQISQTYNILPMNADIFRIWAKLMHKESDTVNEDAMIAATAIVHNLIVVTRNIRDFNRFQVKTYNPF
ncbi:type II toxin-antitoxin system VapC family toxin [bacterium]|jgi:predicted nucleic acid-binding protein|nr:type II toxin-antitoxin system VapC family toxin [bacterium]NBX71350.1 type II toxin-antitoxin system VapC family toxin [bacterium]